MPLNNAVHKLHFLLMNNKQQNIQPIPSFNTLMHVKRFFNFDYYSKAVTPGSSWDWKCFKMTFFFRLQRKTTVLVQVKMTQSKRNLPITGNATSLAPIPKLSIGTRNLLYRKLQKGDNLEWQEKCHLFVQLLDLSTSRENTLAAFTWPLSECNPCFAQVGIGSSVV